MQSGKASTATPGSTLPDCHCSLDCNKKVNHEMRAERFSSSFAPRYRAHFVSAASRTHVRVQDRRKMATKSTPPREQNDHVINSLYAGWGARTRTWEWRNQKSPEQSDLAKLFSRLMVKARMSHQMVMSNFPTGRMVVRQANGKPCRPNPGAPSLRSENLLAWPMKARHGPRGDHCLGEPSRAGAEDTTAPVGDS